jgi:hypothetical protein
MKRVIEYWVDLLGIIEARPEMEGNLILRKMK